MACSFRLASLVLAVTILAGPSCVRAQDRSAEDPPVPVPGELIDIGGSSLNLDCSG
jgi:hypothetical protein